VEEGSRRAVLAALLANLGIAVAKFVAFAVTGATALLAEAIHSVADSGNEFLLAVGGRRSQRQPTAEHPFGFGRERYFFAFVVALVLFSLGSLFAIYEGADKLAHPHPVESTAVGFVVIGVAFVLESLSLRTAVRTFSGFLSASFAPLTRQVARWAAWPDDPNSYTPNWQVYAVAFDLPGSRRVTVVWNGDGTPVRANSRASIQSLGLTGGTRGPSGPRFRAILVDRSLRRCDVPGQDLRDLAIAPFHLAVPRLADGPDLVRQTAQPLFRVVLPQQQPVLGAGGVHAVGLTVVLRHQVVDEHADVGLGAAH